MTSVKQNALVLKTTASGDADLIAELLTRQLGLQKVFIHGGMKSLKRVGSRLGLFNHVLVEYRPKENGLHSFMSLDLVTSYHALSERMLPFCLASHMAETYLKLANDIDWDENFFFLMGSCIKTLHESDPGPHEGHFLAVLQLFFECHLGYLLGFALPPNSQWREWQEQIEQNIISRRYHFDYSAWKNITHFKTQLRNDFLAHFALSHSPSLKMLRDMAEQF